MPKSPRRKTARPYVPRYVIPTQGDYRRLARGVMRIPSRACVDLYAVRDALEDLPAIAGATESLSLYRRAVDAESDAEVLAVLDYLAGFFPDDARWDGFRAYRRAVVAVCN